MGFLGRASPLRNDYFRCSTPWPPAASLPVWKNLGSILLGPHNSLISLEGWMSRERTTRERRRAWGADSRQELGLGERTIRARWSFLEAISTREAVVPALFLGPSSLHPSQQLFQLSSSLLRPPNPPPPFTADDFTSRPTERTKPLVSTGSTWPMDLAVPLGRPGFRTGLCHAYSCWRATYLTSLRLSFLTCKRGGGEDELKPCREFASKQNNNDYG